MGAPRVTVTIRNPADPSKSWDGLFLVDTGAANSLVPRSCIEALGIEPEGQRVYETADGREVRMDFARAYIEFMGDLTAGRIVIGEDGVEPLLGVTAPRVGRHRGGPGEPAAEAPAGTAAEVLGVPLKPSPAGRCGIRGAAGASQTASRFA